MTAPVVAVFRPDDDRLRDAVSLLESLDCEPVADPMLAVDPTGAIPRTDAEFTVLTSKTGVELVDQGDWVPTGEVCAIGASTADALREHGYGVDRVPETYSSAGLVEALRGSVTGSRVEVARSDHGSDVLIDGLLDAGGYVHEGELDGALFSSSLTVEHLVEAAADRGIREAAVAGLNDAVVGAIGRPTADRAAGLGIEVDVVPDEAEFETLAREVVARMRERA
ncbi:uroporphyrinogen-III synthase [Halobacteriales archaeon QS_5_70_15]|nr:MAG: uroporphyrinogen-III synthase [Halobacteriales archaeon QS_5_70_15]